MSTFKRIQDLPSIDLPLTGAEVFEVERLSPEDSHSITFSQLRDEILSGVNTDGITVDSPDIDDIIAWDGSDWVPRSGTFTNIKDFKDNLGVSDDTAAVQQWVNYAANNQLIAFIPANTTVTIKNSVTLPDNVVIFGGNMFTSIVRATNDADVSIKMFRNTDFNNGNSNIKISNMTIDGNDIGFNDPNDGSVCIEMQRVTNILLENLQIIKGGIEGIYLGFCDNIFVNNLLAHDNGPFNSEVAYLGDASGIHLDASTNFKIQNTISYENGFHGIILTNTRYGSVSAVTYGNGFNGGFAQFGCEDVSWDLISYGNFRGFYATTDSKNMRISGSFFNNTNNILTNNVTNTIIDGVHSYGAIENDIYLVGDGDNVIYSNSFPRQPTVQIDFDSAVIYTDERLIGEITGAYTVRIQDVSKVLELRTDNNYTVTIPTQVAVAQGTDNEFDTSNSIIIRNTSSTGVLTLSGASGVTLSEANSTANNVTLNPKESIELVYHGSDNWTGYKSNSVYSSIEITESQISDLQSYLTVVDLGQTVLPDTIEITNTGGSNTIIASATTTDSGLLSSSDKTKLDGISAGAEVNAVDSVSGKTGSVTLDTDDVTEASNLYYTTARTNSDIDIRVDKAFVDALGIDSETLDGNIPAYFLDYNNFTNTPNIFNTISISGQDNVVADSSNDTLTLVAGSNITLTTDSSTDSITISSSGGGGQAFGTISVSGQSDVVADTTSDTLTLVAGTNMTISTNASSDTITFDAATSGGSLTKEEVQDFAWDVLTGTQTLITVTYDDANENVDFIVNDDLSLFDNSSSGFLTDVSFSDIQAGSVLTSIESFIDSDTQLMTAAAIDDHIESKGYTTNTGTVTSVGISGSDGIEIDSGSPVTSSGNISLGINAVSLRSHINVEDGSTADQTEEEIQDAAWNVLNGNQSLITVTYDDLNNNVDFVVENDLSLFDNSISGFISNITGENINELSDVNINTPSDGHAFFYEGTGSEWINRAIVEQDISDLQKYTNSRPTVTLPRARGSYIYSTESGWDDWYAAGDGGTSNDHVTQTGSVTVTTQSGNSNAGISTPILSPTVDISESLLRLFVKCDDWADVSAVVLKISSSEWTFADSVNIDLGTRLVNPPDNEWIEVVVDVDDLPVDGSPNLSAIKQMLLRVQDNGNNRVTVHLDSIATIPDSTTGHIVTITFDDGYDDVIIGKEYMDKYMYAGTALIDPEEIGNSGYLTEEELFDLDKVGWDIGGHHIGNLNNLTQSELEDHLRSTRNYLLERGFRGSDHYSYPNGAFSDNIIKEVRRNFSHASNINGWANGQTYISPYNINRQSIDKFTTQAQVKGWIDDAVANNQWLILNFHTLVSTLVDGQDWLETDFSAIVDYLNTNNVNVQPLSNAIQILNNKQ